jgi:hypothetical protein
LTLASERFVAKILQHLSAPVYILIPTGHAVFIFLGLSFLKIHGHERGIIGEVLIPLLSIALGRSAHERFAIVHKCAFENQMIFCTTADDVF